MLLAPSTAASAASVSARMIGAVGHINLELVVCKGHWHRPAGIGQLAEGGFCPAFAD